MRAARPVVDTSLHRFDWNRQQAIGYLADSLQAELRSRGVRRIDTSCHIGNLRARNFYIRRGFRSPNEERLALVL